MPSPNIDDILTTTLANRTGKLADNVTKNTALLTRLSKKNKIKTFSGGHEIRQELEYAESGTTKRYSGYETLNIAPAEVFTAAKFDIKQAAVSVTISGLEMLQNAGEDQIIDLLEARIDNAEKSLVNMIGYDCYSDGTSDGGKQINGLGALVADVSTSGTVGGINRATWQFWRNYTFGAVADGGGAVTAANITGYMNRAYVSLTRGSDKPDLIVADNNYYLAYLASLQGIQRVSSPDLADAGFESLKFMGADVVMDGGLNGGCPANHMYFLNTKYIFLRPHADRQFVPLGGNRMNTNQDALVKLIGWAGNMTLSNASLQGVIKA